MINTNFLPFPELETATLRMRRLNQKDLQQIFLLRSDDKVMQYIDRKKAETMKEAEDFFNLVDDALVKGDGIIWGIECKDQPGLMIGYVCYWRLLKEHFRAEIGYALLPEFWNKGFMKEVLTEIIKFGYDKMKLHSIEARINPANKFSAALLKSSGFIREAYFKEDYFFNGSFGDTEVYSRLQGTST
ncbi:MAG: GNAT family protein [Ginsengibacter sp.]